MKITNVHGAPDVFVRAAQNDSYSMGDADISVTGLIQPPQIARLRKKHEDKLSSDVRDELWKLLGTGVHSILEANNPGTSEKRYFADHTYGVKISGAIDLLEDGAITDYKVTSEYTVRQPLKKDWESQLNLYAWLLRQNDIEATSLTIVAVCRDWMKSKVERYNNYPSSPIVVIPVPLWLPEVQDNYVNERVAIHTADDTASCTNEERWARGGYKVVSNTGKTKKYDSLTDAAAWINKQKKGHFTVVDEEPKFIRCESWCDVSEFCPQWRGEQNGNNEESDRSSNAV